MDKLRNNLRESNRIRSQSSLTRSGIDIPQICVQSPSPTSTKRTNGGEHLDYRRVNCASAANGERESKCVNTAIDCHANDCVHGECVAKKSHKSHKSSSPSHSTRHPPSINPHTELNLQPDLIESNNDADSKHHNHHDQQNESKPELFDDSTSGASSVCSSGEEDDHHRSSSASNGYNSPVVAKKVKWSVESHSRPQQTNKHPKGRSRGLHFEVDRRMAPVDSARGAITINDISDSSSGSADSLQCSGKGGSTNHCSPNFSSHRDGFALAKAASVNDAVNHHLGEHHLHNNAVDYRTRRSVQSSKQHSSPVKSTHRLQRSTEPSCRAKLTCNTSSRHSRAHIPFTSDSTTDHNMATLPMFFPNPILDNLQVSPKGENLEDIAFAVRSRPKPIKFNLPTIRPQSNYNRMPTTQSSPTITSHYPNVHKFDDHESSSLRSSRANLPTISHQYQSRVSSPQRTTLPPSNSMHSLASALGGSQPISSLATSTISNSATPTKFVPLLISPKDLEAAFLTEPPPQYGITIDNAPNDRIDHSRTSTLSSINHSAHSKLSPKCFADRLHQTSKVWAGARLSILGKPLPTARMKSQSFLQERIWLYNFLQRPTGTVAVSYHSFVAALIIVGLMFFALSTVSHLEWWALNALRVFDLVILSVLTAELFGLFWASSCIGKYQGFKGSVRFLLSPFRLLDLLVIAISGLVCWTHWLPDSLHYLTWLRCGQVFQILRLENRFKPWRLLSQVLVLQKKHMLITAYMCFLILVVLSYVVYFCEQADPNTAFTNIPNAIYWGIITVTSIGYGDIAPKTTAGRLIGSVLAIMGMIVYAIPSGIIATGLALKVQESNRQKHINNRRQPAAQLIQCAWRCYAATLHSTSEATWQRHLKPDRVSHKSTKTPSYHSLDQFGSSKHNSTLGSRFYLMEDDDKSNRASHNDLNIRGQQTLTHAQKNCVRFIRELQFNVARRAFKNAFRPYDIKDVMQQYSEGHSEVVGRVRHMQARLNSLQTTMVTLARMVHDMQTTQAEQMDRVEQTVRALVHRLELRHTTQASPSSFAHHQHQPSPLRATSVGPSMESTANYSEGSTVSVAPTPSAELRSNGDATAAKTKHFEWPPMSEAEESDVGGDGQSGQACHNPTVNTVDAPIGDSSRVHSCCTATDQSLCLRLRHYSE